MRTIPDWWVSTTRRRRGWPFEEGYLLSATRWWRHQRKHEMEHQPAGCKRIEFSERCLYSPMGISRTGESPAKFPVAASRPMEGTVVGARSKSGVTAVLHEDPNDQWHRR